MDHGSFVTNNGRYMNVERKQYGCVRLKTTQWLVMIDSVTNIARDIHWYNLNESNMAASSHLELFSVKCKNDIKNEFRGLKLVENDVSQYILCWIVPELWSSQDFQDGCRQPSWILRYRVCLWIISNHFPFYAKVGH